MYDHEHTVGLLTSANKECKRMSVCLSPKVSPDLCLAMKVFLEGWIFGLNATPRFKCPNCPSCIWTIITFHLERERRQRGIKGLVTS